MVSPKVLEKATHSRLRYHLHANSILVTERYGCRKVVSTEDAALRLTNSVFKSVNRKCMLEEFSVIWQRLLIVSNMKFY